MTTDRLDDDALEAALRAPLAPLPDAGFSAAVMRRIAADVARQGVPIAAEQALERMRATERRERRRNRWALAGLGAGSVLVVGFAAIGSAPPPTGETVLAMALACAVMAWQLAEAVGRPGGQRH